jgi:tRNA modification GTPase
MNQSYDTIFALSSGPPPAAIAVVRISGPQAKAALRRLTRRTLEPKRATLVGVWGADGERIDQALALWFPGPASETGEDTAELQLHGGRAVIAATLAALGEMEGLRGAEAGEFTRRALANGQLDLIGVEALADLVGAETDAQRRQALAQMTGGLRNPAEEWRRTIVSALAQVEAAIDFSDEADVPIDIMAEAIRSLSGLRRELDVVLADAHRGERIRDGVTVAIAGPPNAGKSSLMNWLSRRDVSIVSPMPGTTRDTIEVHLDLAGYPVTIVDTAGVRESEDPVEREGVARARKRADAADIVLWVQDVTSEAMDAAVPSAWPVWNKIDLDSDSKQDGWRISAASGAGIRELVSALSGAVAERFGRGGSGAVITRTRHREAIEAARDSLLRAEAAGLGDEFIAEELRLASRALERLLGRVDVEDVLDVIFHEFCIGK